MFEGVRSFDWLMLWVEVLVVLLILFEILRPMLAERKMRKRVSKVYDFVSRGQMLEHTTPMDGGMILDQQVKANRSAAVDWRTEVQSWIMDTNKFLKTCSPQASAKFLDDSRMSHFSDTTVRFGQETRAQYEVLNCRMSNLQEIMQTPTVYLL